MQLGNVLRAIGDPVRSFGVDVVRWRDSHGASLVHGLLPGSEGGAGPPSVKQPIKKLRRGQLGWADLAVSCWPKHAQTKNWDLVVRDGFNRIVGIRISTEKRFLRVATALTMDDEQLARRLVAAVRVHGPDGVRWRDAGAANTVQELMVSGVGEHPHPSVTAIIERLRRSQDRQADLAIAEGRYVHTPQAHGHMAEIRAEVGRTVAMLPKDVQLRVQDSLIDFGYGRTAQGAWDGYDRIVYVSLAAADPVRTVRHETIHALRQSGLMSDDEFDTLYRFAEANAAFRRRRRGQKRGVLPRPHPLWPIKRAGLVFHGLRKSAVVTLLEVGCTDAEVAAITGQSRQMIEHYSRMVNQLKLAAAAILKWENADGTEFVQRDEAKCTMAAGAKLSH